MAKLTIFFLVNLKNQQINELSKKSTCKISLIEIHPVEQKTRQDK